MSAQYAQRDERLRAWAAQHGAHLADADRAMLAVAGQITESAARQLIWESSPPEDWAGVQACLSDQPDVDAHQVAAGTSVSSVAEQETGRPAADTEDRKARLEAWREELGQVDNQVLSIIPWDIDRLARSDATSAEPIRRLARTLNAGAVVAKYADDIADALTVPRPAPSAPVSVVADEPTQDVASGQMPGTTEGPWLESVVFAPFDFSTTIDDGVALAVMDVAEDDSGGVLLRWSAWGGEGQCVVYRIVADPSQWQRVTPDGGSTLGATMATEVTTRRLSPDDAVTFLTVWAHTGTDTAEACASQGQVIAQGEIVWPVRAVELQVTEGNTVVGRTDAPSNAQLVIQRFGPRDVIRNDPARILVGAEIGDSGFHDRHPRLGVDLVYAVYASVEVKGQRILSRRPATASIRVEPEPESVAVSLSENATVPGTWDISWVDPSYGRVEVFLTPDPVPPGLADGVRARSAIARTNLVADALVNYPHQTVGDRKVLPQCYLNAGWTRNYLTAVHIVSDDRVRVGPTISNVTARPPTDVRLTDRVQTKILTFHWPDGVSKVEVYQGKLGAPVGELDFARRIATVDSLDTYLRQGGMRITQPLPALGCTLHVVGVVYENAGAVRSEAVSVDYPGIAQLRYQVKGARRDGTNVSPNSPPDEVRVLVQSDTTLIGIPLVLVSNPQRLPVYPEDGQYIASTVIDLPQHEDSRPPTVIFRLGVGQQASYLRLFVTGKDFERKVAVIDPPLAARWAPVQPERS